MNPSANFYRKDVAQSSSLHISHKGQRQQLHFLIVQDETAVPIFHSLPLSKSIRESAPMVPYRVMQLVNHTAPTDKYSQCGSTALWLWQ